VLQTKAKANDGSDPPSSHVQEKEHRPGAERPTLPASSRRQDASEQPAAESTELDLWFERARRDLVQRRSPTYGMKAVDSVVEMLLDWGKTVAQGNSFISQHPLPLTRESLAEVDEAILVLRRQRGGRAAA